MKLRNIIFLSALASLTLTGCGDDFFDVENAGVASKDEIKL